MKLISAVDQNWGIGNQGQLLFHLTDDLARFKELTVHNIVVMGRNTLKSLPGGRPLKGRINIVLSSSISRPEGFIVCASIPRLLETLAQFSGKETYIIGGQSVYEQLLPYSTEALITKIKAIRPADTFFPNLDILPQWRISDISEERREHSITFCYLRYKRITD